MLSINTPTFEYEQQETRPRRAVGLKVGEGLPSLRPSASSIVDDEDPTEALIRPDEDEDASLRSSTGEATSRRSVLPPTRCPPVRARRSSARVPAAGRATLPEPALERAKARGDCVQASAQSVDENASVVSPKAAEIRRRVRRRQRTKTSGTAPAEASASTTAHETEDDRIRISATSLPGVAMAKPEAAVRGGFVRLDKRTVLAELRRSAGLWTLAALCGVGMAILGTVIARPLPHVTRTTAAPIRTTISFAADSATVYTATAPSADLAPETTTSTPPAVSAASKPAASPRRNVTPARSASSDSSAKKSTK